MDKSLSIDGIKFKSIGEAMKAVGWEEPSPVEKESNLPMRSGLKVNGSNNTVFHSMKELAIYLGKPLETLRYHLVKKGRFEWNGVVYTLEKKVKQLKMRFEQPQAEQQMEVQQAASTNPRDVMKDLVISLIQKNDIASAQALLGVIDKIN